MSQGPQMQQFLICRHVNIVSWLLGRSWFSAQPSPVQCEETGLWNHIAQNLNPGSHTCWLCLLGKTAFYYLNAIFPNLYNNRYLTSILWEFKVLLHNVPGAWATLKKCEVPSPISTSLITTMVYFLAPENADGKRKEMGGGARAKEKKKRRNSELMFLSKCDLKKTWLFNNCSS